MLALFYILSNVRANHRINMYRIWAQVFRKIMIRIFLNYRKQHNDPLGLSTTTLKI